MKQQCCFDTLAYSNIHDHCGSILVERRDSSSSFHLRFKLHWSWFEIIVTMPTSTTDCVNSKSAFSLAGPVMSWDCDW